MFFRRLLAILLLLIMPLQSTLAAIDSCCSGAPSKQVQRSGDAHAQPAADKAAPADSGDANCCASCDFCHHSSITYLAPEGAMRLTTRNGAPVPHPDFPLESFIPDIPSRPDRG